MSKAFSLVELLISLIVLSILIGAFMLIITKGNDKKEKIFSNNQIDCTKFDALNRCFSCDENKCTACTTLLESAGTNEYVNPALGCDPRPCLEFDSKCIRCYLDGCVECAEGFELDSNGKCKVIPIWNF